MGPAINSIPELRRIAFYSQVTSDVTLSQNPNPRSFKLTQRARQITR
jgi:hypothetical protein